MLKAIKNNYVVLIFSVVLVLLSSGIYLYKILPSRAYDWLYFDSLALIIRSSILHYNVFPLHDPWVCSGTSLLSNPQSWIFSPLIILTLLFPPTMGNLLSLILLKGLGYWGAFKYFRHHNVDKSIALLGSALFINSSWFALHVAEGHIAFRTFFLLPWAFLFIETLADRKTLMKLGFLFLFMLVDGGMYPLIFSLVYFCVYYLFSVNDLNKLGAFIRSNFLYVSGTTLGILLLAVPKIYPVVMNSSGMKEDQEIYTVPLKTLFEVFLNPFNNNSLGVYGYIRFHELGTYIGYSVLALLIICLLKKKDWKFPDLKYLLICAVFFWIGAGLFGKFNPYSIISHVPLIRKAHVQSRYFILFAFFFYFFLARITSNVPFKKVVMGLFLLANVESLVSNFYAFAPGGQNYQLPMLTRESWLVTLSDGAKPHIYYLNGAVSKSCYEPSHLQWSSRALGEQGYIGESKILSGQMLTGHLRQTPGEIQFSYNSPGGGEVLLNTHYLDGWIETSIGAEPFNFQNLLALRLPPGKGMVKLQYYPGYLAWTLMASIVGFLLLFYLKRKTNEL